MKSVILDYTPTGVLKTGQTGSYATGDDGDLENGLDLPNRFTERNIGGVDFVFDNYTGLQWPKDMELYLDMDWASSVNYCNGATLGGFNDWHMPNIKELQSLCEYSSFGTALYDMFFGFDSVDLFWTSTTFKFTNMMAMVVRANSAECVAEIKTNSNKLTMVRRFK